MVRLNELFGDGGEDIDPPKPDIEVPRSGEGDQLTPAKIRGVRCNPVYAGLGPFPSIVSDQAWVKSAIDMISEDGAEQFLVNMLYALRQSLPAESFE